MLLSKVRKQIVTTVKKSHCITPLIKHDQDVQQKEVRKNGLRIIEHVFHGVLKSEDKELWKRALNSMHRHIVELECRVRREAAANTEDADFLVTELWAWNSARRQMCARFGNKFIRPLLSPSPHDQTADQSL